MFTQNKLTTLLASLALTLMAWVGASGLAHAQTAATELCRTEPFAPVVLAPVQVSELPFSGAITFAIAPLAAIAAAINLFAATPFGAVANLVRGLLTEPGLIILRKRRSGFATVYESLSKTPVDLALVRVIDDVTGKVVLTRVTDREGRFVAFLPKGRYRFAVAKRGYHFPTQLLAGETFDPEFGPISTGVAVEHGERGPLEVNLPVDAPEDKVSVKAALRRNFRRGLHQVLAYSGIALGALAVLVAWNWQTWALLGVHVLLFLTFNRLTERPWGRRWGVVRDAGSRQPLPQSVVRLVDARFGRVVETQVVDRHGEYGFAVGRSQFKLFTDHPGYDPYRSESFEVKGQDAIAYRDVALRPAVHESSALNYSEGTP